MTTDQVGTESEEALEVEEKERSYSFSPEVIETLGRSIQLVVGERLCEGALLKMKEPDAWKTMTFKELRKLFKDNCGDQDGYLSSQAPLLETVVRMLLASKRDSLTLSEIHADVSALWISSPWPRHISIDSLQRVLDHGVTYAVVRSE